MFNDSMGVSPLFCTNLMYRNDRCCERYSRNILDVPLLDMVVSEVTLDAVQTQSVWGDAAVLAVRGSVGSLLYDKM